jgi:hypothetical protein
MPLFLTPKCALDSRLGDSSVHWIADWVIPMASLDEMAKRKMCPLLGTKPQFSGFPLLTILTEIPAYYFP